MLYWIDVGYACFGVIVENGYVIKTAPIAKWAKGKRIGVVLNYYRNKKKGKVIRCK